MTAALKQFPARSTKLEKKVDALFHSALTSLPYQVHAWGKHIGTEVRQLSWNLVYILVPFCIILGVMLFWM